MASNDSNEPGNAAAGPAFQVGDRVRFTLGDEAYEGMVERLDPHDADSVTVSDAEDFWYILRRDQLTLVSRATPAPAQAAHDGYDDDVSFSLFCHTNRHEQCHNPDCACSCHDDTPAPSEPATPAPAITHAQTMSLEASGTANSEPATPTPAASSQYRASVPCALGQHHECAGLLIVNEPIQTADDEQPCECPCHQAPTPQPDAPRLDTHTLELPVEMLCEHCAGTGIESGERWDCPACEGRGSFPRCIRLSDEAVDRLAGELAKRLPGIVRMQPDASGK